MFSVKDPIPRGLRANAVYKFLCAGCSACYVGETTPGIFPLAYVSTFSVIAIGPRTSSNIYKILSTAALYALISVLAS